MRLSNYHTHTCFCDGKDSPEELILEAIRLGCPEIGFSGHSHTPHEDYCMTVEGTGEYLRTLRSLRERYADRIRVLIGIEQDYYGDLPTDGYDYIIGSVHSMYKDGVYLCVDYTTEVFQRDVAEHYAGDYYAYAEDYYALVAQVREKTGCQIIGHFDLVTKFNEGDRLFDTGHPRYRKAALAALDRLCAEPVIFEINTGAISRGYRTQPYPQDFILEELRRRKMPLLLSSDCHDRRNLLFGLEALKTQIPEAKEKLFGE